MKMMTKNKYSVFIISHGRANNQLTVNSLRKCGYNDKIYIIVDNLDKQVDEYIENANGNEIVIFDKEKIFETCDTMDNFHNLSSALYARNFCFELAKRLNIDYFVLLDDDIQHFGIRYDDNGSLKRKEIASINEVFDIYINYMQKANITCLGFGNEGGYIGGTGGKFSKGYGRTTNQAMIFKTNTEARFLGTQNEDFNICCKYFSEIFMEIYGVSIMTPVRGTNDGGNNYDLSGMYISNFYSLILAPSFNKIIIGKNITLKRKWDCFVPMILSEEVKK